MSVVILMHKGASLLNVIGLHYIELTALQWDGVWMSKALMVKELLA